MKLLVRGKTNFLEAELETLEPTDKEVDPKTLVHFGTDLISDDRFEFEKYIKKMEKLGIDYLFVSQQCENVEYAQCGKVLRILTAYKKI